MGDAMEGVRARLRLHGVQSLANDELVCLVAGEEQMDVARRFLDSVGSIALMKNMDIQEYCDHGFTEQSAAALVAVSELAKRSAAVRRYGGRCRLLTSEDIALTYMGELSHQEQERLMIVSLNKRFVPIAEEMVSLGTVDSAPFSVSDCLRLPIKRGATGIVALHNHPSGNPSPSEADLDVARYLAAAGTFFQIKLIDSIVIGDGTYASIRRQHPEIFEESDSFLVSDATEAVTIEKAPVPPCADAYAQSEESGRGMGD
jgi:DNA repair protein RadC